MTERYDLECGECGAPMKLRKSKFGPFYGCTKFPKCRGTHGAHPNGKPLGTPANKATKRARQDAHATFDQLWRKGSRPRMTRLQAYAWLKAQPTVPNHIAEMSTKDCENLIELVKWELKVPGSLRRSFKT